MLILQFTPVLPVAGNLGGNDGGRVIQKKRLQLQKKVTIISFTVCLVFFLTWVPFCVVVLASLHVYIQPTVLQLTAVATFLNTMANMVIYCSKSSEYRENIKTILPCGRGVSQG